LWAGKRLLWKRLCLCRALAEGHRCSWLGGGASFAKRQSLAPLAAGRLVIAHRFAFAAPVAMAMTDEGVWICDNYSTQATGPPWSSLRLSTAQARLPAGSLQAHWRAPIRAQLFPQSLSITPRLSGEKGAPLRRPASGKSWPVKPSLRRPVGTSRCGKAGEQRTLGRERAGGPLALNATERARRTRLLRAHSCGQPAAHGRLLTGRLRLAPIARRPAPIVSQSTPLGRRPTWRSPNLPQLDLPLPVGRRWRHRAEMWARRQRASGLAPVGKRPPVDLRGRPVERARGGLDTRSPGSEAAS